MSAAMTARAQPGGRMSPMGISVGVLIALTIASAAWFRLSGQDIHVPDAPVTKERSLRFIDRPDGSVTVLDAATGARVLSIEGEAGFARGTLRGFARERRLAGAGDAAPFLLQAHADGRLTLSDPATGRRVDLESFGPTNAGVFARMLTPGAQP